MKLHVVQFSPVSRRLRPLRPKHFSHLPIAKINLKKKKSLTPIKERQILSRFVFMKIISGILAVKYVIKCVNA